MKLISALVWKLCECKFTGRRKLAHSSILATAEGRGAVRTRDGWRQLAAAAGTPVYGQPDVSRHSRTAVSARVTIFAPKKENVLRHNAAFE